MEISEKKKCKKQFTSLINEFFQIIFDKTLNFNVFNVANCKKFSKVLKKSKYLTPNHYFTGTEAPKTGGLKTQPSKTISMKW